MTDTIPTPTSLAEVPAAVEARLSTFFATAIPATAAISPAVGAAAELVRDFVLGGGKRIRPTFAHAGWWCGITNRAGTGAAMNGDPDHSAADEILRVGAALELVQACALIHDDIIDRSDTRRGHPTAHRLFEQRHRDAGWSGDPADYGVASAILAGDLALAWADDLVHGHTPTDGALPPEQRRRPLPWEVGHTWSMMRTEVLGGQVLDIVNESSGDESADAAYRVMEFKTAAYTVARPLELGARLADAGDDLVTALRRVGHDLGIAFQLRDDLLGVFGDPQRTGKPSGDDLVSGKRTLLIATGLARAAESDPASADRLRGHLGRPLSEAELASARGILRDTGALDEVEARIDALLATAVATLDALDIGADIRADLVALAHRTAHREV